ncbi:MAG: CAP domain-containing protein, partial [Candidatus Saccharibacteria bacterium]
MKTRFVSTRAKSYFLTLITLTGAFVAAGAQASSISGLESLTNQQRTASGLPALVDDYRLDTAAANKAADMIANNYWAHTSPTGVSPWYWLSAA